MIRIIVTLYLFGQAPTIYVGDYTYQDMSRCRAAALDIVQRIKVDVKDGISATCRRDKET